MMSVFFLSLASTQPGPVMGYYVPRGGHQSRPPPGKHPRMARLTEQLMLSRPLSLSQNQPQKTFAGAKEVSLPAEWTQCSGQQPAHSAPGARELEPCADARLPAPVQGPCKALSSREGPAQSLSPGGGLQVHGVPSRVLLMGVSPALGSPSLGGPPHTQARPSCLTHMERTGMHAPQPRPGTCLEMHATRVETVKHSEMLFPVSLTIVGETF